VGSEVDLRTERFGNLVAVAQDGATWRWFNQLRVSVAR
jgi:hypothetical protein